MILLFLESLRHWPRARAIGQKLKEEITHIKELCKRAHGCRNNWKRRNGKETFLFYWLAFWPFFIREGEGKGRLVDIRLIFLTERERHLTAGKRAVRTKLDFRCPSLPLCHWSSQLFDLCAPSSTDVPVMLLNQPIMALGVGVYLMGGAYSRKYGINH